jgi:hypothetical protein
LVPFPFLRLNRPEAGDVVRETLTHPRGQRDVAANDVLVERCKV